MSFHVFQAQTKRPAPIDSDLEGPSPKRQRAYVDLTQDESSPQPSPPPPSPVVDVDDLPELDDYDFPEYDSDTGMAIRKGPKPKVSENLMPVPREETVSCKCTAAGNCQTRRCGCSKWGYACSKTCGCKGKCGNPINDDLIVQLFNVPDQVFEEFQGYQWGGSLRKLAESYLPPPTDSKSASSSPVESPAKEIVTETRTRHIKPRSCFIQWYTRMRKAHPEQATLYWIWRTVFGAFEHNTEARERYADTIQDWCDRWQQLRDEGKTVFDPESQEMMREIVRLGCAESTPMYISWCKGFWEGRWVSDEIVWHCEICRTCNHWKEWHCGNCNKCVDDSRDECERCGGISEIASHMLKWK